MMMMMLRAFICVAYDGDVDNVGDADDATCCSDEDAAADDGDHGDDIADCLAPWFLNIVVNATLMVLVMAVAAVNHESRARS